jgi:myosin heavy subunit
LITEEGLTNLIGAIFRLVAQDIRYGNDSAREDALDFLQSSWYMELCDLIEVDPKKLRKLILKNKIAWRNKYE